MAVKYLRQELLGKRWFALQGSELNDKLNKFFWGKIYETRRCRSKNYNAENLEN